MAFLIPLLTSFTGSFLMNGLAQLLFGGIASAGMAYLAIGAFLVGLTAWIYLRWKREEEARLNRSRAAWDAHLKALHARMDRFLEEMYTVAGVAPPDPPDLYVGARLREGLCRAHGPMVKTRLQVAANVNYDLVRRY